MICVCAFLFIYFKSKSYLNFSGEKIINIWFPVFIILETKILWCTAIIEIHNTLPSCKTLYIFISI